MKKLTILGSVLALLCAAAMSPGGDKSTVPARLSLILPAAARGPVDISNSQTESSQPLIGVDATGNAYAVWYENLPGRTFYFSTNKSGAWSAPAMIESLNHDTEESGWPIWAVAPNGAAHLAFFDAKAIGRDDGLMTYDVFDRAYENGTWGPTTNVTTNNVQNASIYPGMAINPVDNYTYLIWSDHNGTPDRVIKARYRKADGTWVPTPFPLVGSNDAVLPVGFGDIPRIAVDGQGTAHMVWGYIHGRTIWYSKNRTPQNKSGWTSPLMIKWDAGNEWSGPNVAADDAGNAYIYWTDGPAVYGDPTGPGNNAEIALCKVDSNGVPGAAINISSSAGVHSYDPSLAVNPVTGDIAAAWTENGNIMGNVCVGGQWSGPTNITNNPSGAESRMPGVAADKSGGAYLVYSHRAAGSADWDIMFLAVSQPTNAPLSVTAPNGGESWYIGSTHAVTWTTTGSIANVKIEYSTNGGSGYATIIGSTPNTGSYAWTVPNAPSANCLVKVSDASNAATSDASNAAFVIMAPPVAPTVTTAAATAVLTTTAASGGTVTSDGGATVTARGVCWSTSANPTTADSTTTDGSGTGAFSSSIGGLSPTTTYHVRAYARNAVGTSYGADVTFLTKSQVLGKRNDFNSDGQEDILWRNSATGDNIVWFMSGPTMLSYARITSVADVNWQAVGTGDFNGDGKSDILWRNAATGDNIVWFMSGAAMLSYARLTPIADLNWKMVGSGDFNGDGKPDILWRNAATGDNIVWFMSGPTLLSYARLTSVADLNWKIGGTGDFDGDGKPDILWRNAATGDDIIWFMNGVTMLSYARITPVADLNWQIGGTGVFNAAGKTDILWRHAVTGQNVVWHMNGATLTGYEYTTPITDPNWKIMNR